MVLKIIATILVLFFVIARDWIEYRLDPTAELWRPIITTAVMCVVIWCTWTGH